MAFDRGALLESNSFGLAFLIRKQFQRNKEHYESKRAAEYRERLMIRKGAVALERKSFLSRRESHCSCSIIKLIMEFMAQACAMAAFLTRTLCRANVYRLNRKFTNFI